MMRIASDGPQKLGLNEKNIAARNCTPASTIPNHTAYWLRLKTPIPAIATNPPRTT